MPDQAPNIEPGKGRLVYDKTRRTIVAKDADADIKRRLSKIEMMARALERDAEMMLAKARGLREAAAAYQWQPTGSQPSNG